MVTLNRAVAVSKAQGPEAALAMIEPLAGDLSGYFYFFGVKGAMLQKLGRTEEARIAFDRAIALANNAAEAAHIRLQLDRLQQGSAPAAKKFEGLVGTSPLVRPRDRELKTRRRRCATPPRTPTTSWS